MDGMNGLNEEVSSAVELNSRRVAHPKPRYRPVDVAKWLMRPFELAPRSRPGVEVIEKAVRRYRTPAEWRKSSRFGARRRARRLRYRRKLRTILWTKRISYTLVAVILILLVAFWAKLAVVYGLPTYVRIGNLAHARAYLVWKSWWFGPTSFNLADYTGVDPLNPIQSLALQLSEYKDIVTNPQEVLFIFTNK
ncbi:MAG: hypothetical protein OWT28_04280 [Firmicutes bacterium]|nr:hypothetical protein [Bacillota bacterium]